MVSASEYIVKGGELVGGGDFLFCDVNLGCEAAGFSSNINLPPLTQQQSRLLVGIKTDLTI